MSSDSPSLLLAQLSFRIAPQRIAFLKFILEGYDGLALLSTRNRVSGEVVLFYPDELHSDVISLVDTLSVDLGLHVP